jgi:hypothetical protein
MPEPLPQSPPPELALQPRSLLFTKPQYLCQYLGLDELRVTSSSARIELGERILLFSKSYIESTCVLVNAETPNAISVRADG